MKKYNPLLPETANNEYNGYNFAKYVFVVLIVITVIRSCIHVFAPDGGAGTIARFDTSGPQGQNLISIFAQWGLMQLIIAFFFIIVYLRYQSLISFCWLLVFIEYTGRLLVGVSKPVVLPQAPPGAHIILLIPISIVMLYFSLKIPKNKRL
jgi:hypothetical protein